MGDYVGSPVWRREVYWAYAAYACSHKGRIRSLKNKRRK